MVAIDIRGAKGPNAVTINGIYEPTHEVCSGWPVYRKRNDNNKWLEFFDASKKWYIKATTDKGRARGWMRLTSNPTSRPEECSHTCEVWDGSKWTSQPSVSIVTLKQRRFEDKKAGAERRLQATPVDIRGAHGPSATSINGVYEPTNEQSGGWPVYKKQNDPDKWLEYIVATNEWYVKPTADKGKAEGWMCLASDPPTRPELSRGTCEVWDGDRWTLQSCVTVMTAACAFSSMIDLQLFCAEEAKSTQEKLCSSMKRVITLLDTVPIDRVREGHIQCDKLIEGVNTTVELLRKAKKKKSGNDGSAGGTGGAVRSTTTAAYLSSLRQQSRQRIRGMDEEDEEEVDYEADDMLAMNEYDYEEEEDDEDDEEEEDGEVDHDEEEDDGGEDDGGEEEEDEEDDDDDYDDDSYGQRMSMGEEISTHEKLLDDAEIITVDK